MLGIYGGTFDPVHYGHLRTAVEVKEALQLSELRFIPCRIPPHRTSPGANPEQRIRMLELALPKTETGFSIDRRELDRDGPSYMFDTLTSLREEKSDRPIFLILGFDAFAGLPTWHRWRELFNLAHLAVMQRPYPMEPSLKGELADIALERREKERANLSIRPNGNIAFLEVTQLAISATLIRAMIAQGKNPRYLLPDPVLAMIESEGLYLPLSP